MRSFSKARFSFRWQKFIYWMSTVIEHVTPHPQILLTDNPLNGGDMLNAPKLNPFAPTAPQTARKIWYSVKKFNLS